MAPDIAAFDTPEDEPLLRMVDERCVRISRNAETDKLEVLMRVSSNTADRGNLVAVPLADALAKGIVARADESLF